MSHHPSGELCAIFIHAGAGYHSHQNEKTHLIAVNDAARVGMAILKNGGDATDAVEMAIRLLEDSEITNAGYGSNLTLDGEVECDATLVDHFGRSGAVGAVSRECHHPRQSLSHTHDSQRPFVLRPGLALTDCSQRSKTRSLWPVLCLTSRLSLCFWSAFRRIFSSVPGRWSLPKRMAFLFFHPTS